MSLDHLVSPRYRSLLVQWYEQGTAGQPTGYQYAPDVDLFSYELQACSILDYGCGMGSLIKQLSVLGWVSGLDLREYDPAIPIKSGMPFSSDLVVCTDVLEHVEPDKLANVVAHIRQLSIKGTYLAIACCPSGELLPDGRNAHLIQQLPGWWMKLLVNSGFNIVDSRCEGFVLKVWAKS